MKTHQVVAIGGAWLAAMAALAGLPAQAGSCGARADCSDTTRAGRAGKPAGRDQAEREAVRRLVVPIDATPHGKTYGHWAAHWWQWALQQVAPRSPVTDPTGQFCAEGQVGDVWFLAGQIVPGSTQRSCTVPAGKALFFPLLDSAWFAFLNDPAETRTEAFVRAAAACTLPASISVWIDDVEIRDAERFFTGPSGSPSPLFAVQLPVDNVLPVTADVAQDLMFSPSAEQGYYLFLRPLPPGRHTIRWDAQGCQPGYFQNVRYQLTVLRE